MSHVLPTLVWDDEPTEFIEALVEANVNTFYLQLAIEAVIRSAVLEDVTTAFVLDNEVFRVHRTPPFLGLPELYVTITVSEDGQMITVRDICFAQEHIQ